MTAEEILKDMPSIKQGFDDFYGRQTVLNALNLALSQEQSLPTGTVINICTCNTDQVCGICFRDKGYDVIDGKLVDIKSNDRLPKNT